MISAPSFQQYAERDPKALAIIEPAGRKWSRGELANLTNRLARAFTGFGLVQGDVLAIIAPNCAEYLAVYLAGIQAGLFVVPINWQLAGDEIAFVVMDSGARVVVVHEHVTFDTQAEITELCCNAELLLAIGRQEGLTSLEDFVSEHIAEPLESHVPAGRMMAYTSATTGRPKAIILPPSNGQQALARFMAWHHTIGVALEDDNVHLCCSMLYHSAPLLGTAAALHMGHSVVLVRRSQPIELLQLIEQYQVTTTFMVPMMFVRLLKLEESERSRFSTASLRFVMHGGAPCPLEIKRRMIEWWGNVIWESYGAAEGQGTFVSTEEWLRFPGTVGRPVPGSAIKILNDEGKELPANEVGTIYLRPYTGDRFEYKGDRESTRLAYRGDFLTVGDLGYLNEHGYLFICDRRTDLIISAGVNIYPAEIEAVLIQHPLVADCAIVGVPNDLLGAIPKAFVQTESGIEPGPGLTAELLRFLGARLAATKVPKRIEYLARLPRDSNGKLYKRHLRLRGTFEST